MRLENLLISKFNRFSSLVHININICYTQRIHIQKRGRKTKRKNFTKHITKKACSRNSQERIQEGNETAEQCSNIYVLLCLAIN